MDTRASFRLPGRVGWTPVSKRAWGRRGVSALAVGVFLTATMPGAVVPAAGTQAPATTVPADRAPARDTVGGRLLERRGVVVDPGPRAAPLPPIRARAWVLADLDTGEVLAAKHAHLRLPPASTLKTLTSVTLLPRLDPDEVYTARESDVAADGGHVGIVAGGTYTVEDLFNALLLPSGNDAAAALAHANGGVARTVRQMNVEARRLQANDTVARNPSGLDAPGQVSTPYDLALIARAGMAREDFSAYVSRMSADFPGLMPKKGKKRKTFKIFTQNRLLLHGFRGAIGVKTGWTTKAGRTFVGAARRNGHTLVVALMQITDWSETAAANALDWGFANLDRVRPVGTLVDPLDAVPARPGPGGGSRQGAGGNGRAPDVATVQVSTTAPIPPGTAAAVVGLAALAALGAAILAAGVLAGRD